VAHFPVSPEHFGIMETISCSLCAVSQLVLPNAPHVIFILDDADVSPLKFGGMLTQPPSSFENYPPGCSLYSGEPWCLPRDLIPFFQAHTTP
jgi:hypothetical protein